MHKFIKFEFLVTNLINRLFIRHFFKKTLGIEYYPRSLRIHFSPSPVGGRGGRIFMGHHISLWRHLIIKFATKMSFFSLKISPSDFQNFESYHTISFIHVSFTVNELLKFKNTKILFETHNVLFFRYFWRGSTAKDLSMQHFTVYLSVQIFVKTLLTLQKDVRKL